MEYYKKRRKKLDVWSIQNNKDASKSHLKLKTEKLLTLLKEIDY